MWFCKKKALERAAIVEWRARLEQTVASVLAELAQFRRDVMEAMDAVKASTDALVARVTAEQTVIDSAMVLIKGLNASNADLSQKLKDALATPADLQAKAQAVVDEMDATKKAVDDKMAELAAAVLAGTPSSAAAPPAPAPTPPAPPPPDSTAAAPTTPPADSTPAS
jgi:ABC-type transporter Mla subunit MlaD